MRFEKVKLIILLIVLAVSMFAVFKIAQSDRHIPKENTIEVFNSNFDKFLDMVQYSEETAGYFYADNNSDRLIIDIGNRTDKMNNKKTNDTLLFIIKKLKFKGVYEDGDYIRFMRESGNDEQGILYLKNPNLSLTGIELELIRGKWYYYIAKHVN